MRAGVPDVEVETEVTLPESSRAIDMVLEMTEAAADWGVIASDLVLRTVLIEHFDRAPTPARLAGCFLRIAWAVERWAARPRRERPAQPPRERPARPPLLLALSVGRPRGGLRLFRALKPDRRIAGLYRTLDHGLDVVLVDVRAVPPSPDTAFLRLFDHRPAVAAANLDRLLSEPSVAKLTKERVMEAIVKKPALFDVDERELTFEKLVAIGVAKGLEQGRAQGLEQGRALGLEQGLELGARNALLDLLRTTLGDEAAHEAAAIASFDALREHVVRALSKR